jgi:hypothetical protein
MNDYLLVGANDKARHLLKENKIPRLALGFYLKG